MSAVLFYSGSATSQGQSWQAALSSALAQHQIELAPLARAAHEAPETSLQRALAAAHAASLALLYFCALDDPALASVNRLCYHARLPLILLAQLGPLLQLGPAVLAGQTPCIECYRRQRAYFLSVGAGSAQREAPLTDQAGPAEPLIKRLGLELASLLGPARASELGRNALLQLDSKGTIVRQPRLFRHPTCEVCSPWSRHPSEVLHIR